MDLKDYFESTDGVGILSTADSAGNVDSAIYATPHVITEDRIGFIMRPRLSLKNVQQNPKAVYMFIEKGPGYQGRRLYLEKTHEEDDPAKVQQYRRSSHGHGSGDESEASFVHFKVIRIRPLVGDQEQE